MNQDGTWNSPGSSDVKRISPWAGTGRRQERDRAVQEAESARQGRNEEHRQAGKRPSYL